MTRWEVVERKHVFELLVEKYSLNTPSTIGI